MIIEKKIREEKKKLKTTRTHIHISSEKKKNPSKKHQVIKLFMKL